MKATTLRTDIPATTLREIAKTEKSGAVCRRLLGLAHLLEGGHRAEAQRIACLTTCTFRGWMKQFNDEGIAGLYPRKRPGRPSRMSQEVVCKLKEKVLSGPSPEEGLVRYRIVDLQTYLEKEHQISFGISRIWYVLQDLNISWKTGRQRHPKSDEQAQEAFKKNFKNEIGSLQQRHPDKIIEIWFQDEARVGQQGRLTRLWGEKGKRLRIVKDMRFEYTYIYGAICPERDTGEAIVIGSVGKEEMLHHLNIISQNIPKNRHAVIVMDKAPWHRSLKIPENITIIYLPSYSPELNPHENIWEYVKANYLSNKVFDTLDHVTQACCDAWNALCGETGRIRSIGTRDWVAIDK